MRTIILLACLLLTPGMACAQADDSAYGAYRHGERELILAYLPDIDAPTLVDFPSGRVRALGRADGAFVFGSSIGGRDDAGRISISENGVTLSESDARTDFQRVPLRTREVRFASGDHELAGTLTLPEGDGPFPAVVLLHGGGPQTRDFWWVAPFFAARGVAVLAYDKQGVGGSSGDWQAAGLSGLAADGAAALNYLRGLNDIDARRVGLYGSSNGGWVAPMAAHMPGADPAFVIARSPSALPELANISLEVAGDLEDAGFGADAIAACQEIYALRMRTVRDLNRNSWEAYRAAIARHSGAPWFDQSRLPRELLAWTPENVEAIENAVGYWRRNWIDPADVWREVRAPILIQIGASDRSIPGPPSAEILAIAVSHNRLASVRLYADGDHALFANPSGRSRDIPQAQGFATDYLPDLDAFVRAHVLQGAH